MMGSWNNWIRAHVISSLFHCFPQGAELEKDARYAIMPVALKHSVFMPYLLANTLVFLPYLLAIAIVYSISVYFLVGLCGTWNAFAYFILVVWIILLMANSFVLFLSAIAPNFIAGTSLFTVLLAGFFLFSRYFISKDSMPKFWLFMHYLLMYKYALDALLINEYSCLVSTCLIWFDDEKKTCMVNGGDVMEKRGLHERLRWINVYVMNGCLEVLCWKRMQDMLSCQLP